MSRCKGDRISNLGDKDWLVSTDMRTSPVDSAMVSISYQRVIGVSE